MSTPHVPENTPSSPEDSIHDGRGTYDVVLLVEQALTSVDAEQVRSLHSEIEDPVVYHVLLPLEDAAARIEATLGTLGAGDLMAAPALAMNDVDIDALRRECEEQSSSDLQQTLKAIAAAGGTAHGKVTSEPPVDALAALVTAVDAREAIILTRPHVVAEFFHVDWTSRARRKLGVPVLHLIEHENFDEQASGSGEGVSGL
ncbi:hypothetical protein GCM10011376_28340 [Nocardioides flavus (ex Wang et al. 2016)]|uniref:Indole-3-glycerol phosphate synthase n=1 Tax=Nocardioides flavus (ex Wang et al. 2016) TaxID=2058780 RepID=A0ABQ3HQ12_9ACTN|nr:hypothetical protein [Nocardioides flavus (ex Wang et al. 2016)]GHE18224.1 hypothetical protein GCM10011376_28340 [Nocardioides flavus (ex Wang et al. 2016)]